MRYDPAKHHRRSLRLKRYDYSQAGIYFVTICVQGRATVLGEVVNEAVQLSAAGRFVQACWETIPQRFAGVTLDAYVAMPNHLHGIIIIGDGIDHAGAIYQGAINRAPTLGQIIRAFKAVAAWDSLPLECSWRMT
jgi:putative transposase